MNIRDLNKGESHELSRLNATGVDSVLIYLTETGLNKSLLDATEPFRSLLRESGIHNYAAQEAGGEKVYRPIVFFVRGKLFTLRTSFYRPKTKNGDPRFWPSCLNHYVKGGDVLAAFSWKGSLYFTSLSSEFSVTLDSELSEYDQFLEEIKSENQEYSKDLLAKLQSIAATGPLIADGTGDTSIGRTIEKALGIMMNSSKEPDYRGIEIKSKRRASNTRNGLFAQVPNWDISQCKSFKEILDLYGYMDSETEEKRLYCTVSSKAANNQGLILNLKEDINQLEELYQVGGKFKSVSVWTLEKLHHRLQTKHPETFWIQAEELTLKGCKYFELQSILHTRRPSNNQFNRLLTTGGITVDHMIKVKGNSVHEKGPQFKVKRSELNELFLGVPVTYDLR